MFGKKKRCPNCGKEIKKEFSFCPYCGEEIEEEANFDLFEDIEKEFERIDKMFGLGFPKFKKPLVRGGGVSITIHSGLGKEPKVEVKTSGEYKKIEPEIKKRLGLRPGVEEVEEEVEKVRAKPRIMEEPETKIERVGDVESIEVKLPGVKNEKDIEIKKLEQSIEIKAYADDKVYFTLVPLKNEASIMSKEFKNEVLKIKVKR